MPERMLDRMLEYRSRRMPDRMSKSLSQRMPERISEYMPERMSEYMPDKKTGKTYIYIYMQYTHFQMVCQKLPGMSK